MSGLSSDSEWSPNSSECATEVSAQYFNNLEKILTNPDGSKVPPSHIFNYDETNLSDDPGTKRCLYKRGVKYSDRVRDSSKLSTSIMFCGADDGTMLPAHTLFISQSTRGQRKPKVVLQILDTIATIADASICTALQIGLKQYSTVFVRNASQLPGRKVVIGDNLKSHFSEQVLRLAKDNNISFKNNI